MGKFESSKGVQGRVQVAEQVGYASIPTPLLRAAGDTGARSTGISVTAGAIGMGLAAQSASQDGLMAFAATLPGADVLASLAKGDPQGPSTGAADVVGAEGIGGDFQPDGAAIEAHLGADPLAAETSDTASYDTAVTPGVQESQLTSHIAIDPSAVVGEAVQEARSAPVNSPAGTQPNVGASGGEKVVSTITIVPGDSLLPDDIPGDDGPVGSIVGSLIGDDGLVDGLLDGVLGEGSLLDSVLGEDGVVGVLLGEDGIVSGLLGDGGVIDSVLGEGGLVDGLVGGVLGEDGLVGGLLGDDGLVGGLLGQDGVVDNLLGDDGVVGGLLGEDGLVGGLLGDDGLVGGLLGDNGVVDVVLGDDGLVGGLLGEDGVVGGLLGDDGLVGGLLGDNGVVDVVLGDDGLVGGLLGEDGVVGGLLGDDGLVGGVLGDNGVVDVVLGDDGLVGGLLGDDGVVGGLLGDDGVVGGLLGDNGVVDVVLGDDGLVGGLLGDDGVVDDLLGDDGLVGGVLGDNGVVDVVLGDDGLVGGLLGDDGVVDDLLGDDGLVGGVLGDNGVVDVVLGDNGLVGGLLGDGGLLGGLLGGGAAEVEEDVPAELTDTGITEVSGVLETGTETVTQVADGVLGDGGLVDGIIGDDGLVGGALGEDGVVDELLGDDGLVGGLLGGLLGGGAAEVEEDVPAELTDTGITEVSGVLETGTETVTQVADGVLGDGGLVDGIIGDDGVVDELLGDDGLVGGLLGGVLGGGAAEVEEDVPTELTDTTTPEVSDALEDGAATAEPAINAVLGAGSVVNEVPIVGGILGGLLGGQAASAVVPPLTEGSVAGLSEGVTAEPNDAQTLIGQDETDPVAPTDTPDTSSEADVSGAALLDDVPVTEDAGDDGFLDTLVAGDSEDLLGSVETLLDPSDALLDGLLGEVDVFGLNVVEGGEGDDLFAGLTGEQGLTGSLVEQDVLGLSDPIEDDAPDAEVDNLLNDILAGGVSDITGEEGAFDALFGSDAMAEEEGELLGVEDAAVAEAGAVEGALDILFDQGADQGHSLLGGLLQETFDNDNA
ncbi:hypothetical protein DSM110093_03744 (plasmid) [Sulfitobacter sp. DSM 110093]|uniref:beta strand repeat-containing protein n=1 Tax=Sulfitobacter sp. DSM 110093 TaxID=2883127 RepID=UPI001FAC1664|nr:hypothetical protein [Sulfitobacter sp. DSM 110093]UOA33909.1 hypothetical protein DSM110093_03744 [Sulfitobacter sp. DSM 110093]